MTETYREGAAGVAPPGSEIAAGMLREAGAWASVQGEWVSAVEAMWSGWAKRRREALDASTRSMQEMLACRDFGKLMQLQQQWLADTARRTASEISTLASEGAAITARLADVPRAGLSAGRQPSSSRPSRPPAETPLERAAAAE